jgi:hypothetical protein
MFWLIYVAYQAFLAWAVHRNWRGKLTSWRTAGQHHTGSNHAGNNDTALGHTSPSRPRLNGALHVSGLFLFPGPFKRKDQQCEDHYVNGHSGVLI